MAEQREFRAVGRRVPRHESVSKVTGAARYTDDLRLPGEVCAVLVRSPYPRARVRSIDLSGAERVEGYLGCLLPEDVTPARFNASGNPPSPLLIPDEVLLTREPKTFGDRILCLAAETEDACRRAAEAVRIEYEVLRPYLTVKEALAPEAEPIQPELADTNVCLHREAAQGSRAAGEAQSDVLLEGHFSTQPMQHATIEPTSCLCDFSDGEHLVVYSCSQTVFQERRILAQLLGLRESCIRMIKPTVGAGFGARQQIHAQHICAFMAKKLRRPVRLSYTREEDLAASCVRHASETDVRLGADRDGNLRLFDAHLFLPTGPYTTHGPTVMMASSRKFQYRVDNYFFTGETVYTNHATGGAFRGYGNTQLTFARELMMDRMADALGMDPVEFRLRNHVRAGERFPCAALPVSSCAIDDCVEKARALQRAVDAREGPLRDDGEIKEAWGCAFACHGSGASNLDGLSSAVILLNDDGSVQLLVGSADIGQGSETMEQQICAEALGIAPEDVSIAAADTGRTPYDSGTFGSSQTYLCGNAIRAAARDFNEKFLAQLRVVFPGAAVERTESGFCVTEGGEARTLSFREAAASVMFSPDGAVIIGSGSYKAHASPNPFAVCFAKVAYHKKLNAIRVLDLIQVADVGTPVNPLTVEGQLEGGVAQALGWALYENVETAPRTKGILSTDLLHYRIPQMDDMPNVLVAIADGWEPTGPFGAKSVGELATIPGAPAIVNAVRRASGVEISRIPLCEQFVILSGRRSEAQP